MNEISQQFNLETDSADRIQSWPDHDIQYSVYSCVYSTNKTL